MTKPVGKACAFAPRRASLTSRRTASNCASTWSTLSCRKCSALRMRVPLRARSRFSSPFWRWCVPARAWSISLASSSSVDTLDDMGESGGVGRGEGASDSRAATMSLAGGGYYFLLGGTVATCHMARAHG